MKPWIRRILLVVVILGLFCAGGVAAAWWAFTAEPDWYNQALERSRTVTASPDTAIINAASAVNERHRAPDAEEPIVFTLTEAQLNGALQGRSTFDAAQAVTAQLDNPVLELLPNQILLAGRLARYDKVVALTLAPKVEDGMLTAEIVSLRGGRLPLPRSMLNNWREPGLASLRRQAPAWQRNAELRPNNLANDAAAAAVHGLVAEALLAEEAIDAVLMLPVDEAESGWMPVRVESLVITDEAVTVQLQPLSLEDRRALIAALRGA